MIRLLYRFFEPQSGSIYIGGQNINDVDIHSLRKSIAIVPQVSVSQEIVVSFTNDNQF